MVAADIGWKRGSRETALKEEKTPRQCLGREPREHRQVCSLGPQTRGRMAGAQPRAVSGPETEMRGHKGTSETNRRNLSHVSVPKNERHESWGPTIKGKEVGERTKIRVDWEVDKNTDGALSLKEKGFKKTTVSFCISAGLEVLAKGR